MNPTEQAHDNLKSILLDGRILLNGNPLTGNEITSVIRGEQMLFEKASKFDQQKESAKASKILDKKKE